MDATTRIPLARSEGLVVEELGHELLVYDMDTDHAHCLGPVAARIWRKCDGRTTAEAIGDEAGLSAGDVTQALDELARCGLLIAPLGDRGLSRRDFGLRLTKVGAAAASVPLIVSIMAPTAAQAQTPCFSGELQGCGPCNQGGTPTSCCCCHGTGPGRPGASPFACASGAADCCARSTTPNGTAITPTHCTEQGGQQLPCV